MYLVIAAFRFGSNRTFLKRQAFQAVCQSVGSYLSCNWKTPPKSSRELGALKATEHRFFTLCSPTSQSY